MKKQLTLVVATAAIMCSGASAIANEKEPAKQAPEIAMEATAATQAQESILTGEVQHVNKDENSFILKEESGETLNIVSDTSVNELKEGDKVSIHGKVDPSAPDDVRAIVSAKVRVEN